MQSPCALYVPHYTVRALRARGKRAVSRLTLTLSGCQLLSQGGPCVRLARYRRRRKALRRQRCTARRIGGCDKHCDDNDAQPDRFSHGQRGRDLRYAHQRAPRKLSMPPTILSRRYAPAASVQSSYLTLSGCQLLSQGRPGVRLARHQRRSQALRRQLDISTGGRRCDDNDSQPDASAAATSTANTTMHNPTAFHTAGVTTTCATLARFSTRTTKAKRSCSRLSPSLPSLSLPATF